MAYIHLSAKSAVERHFCHQREPLRFYTPLTFMEFVHLFKVVAAYVVKRERVGTQRNTEIVMSCQKLVVGEYAPQWTKNTKDQSNYVIPFEAAYCAVDFSVVHVVVHEVLSWT